MLTLKNRKVGIIGAGNMAQAIVKALVDTKTLPASHIYMTNRTDKKLERVVEALGVQSLHTNEELVDTCDVVILAMKPQDLFVAIEPIAMSFGNRHIVVSLAAGIPLHSLQRVLTEVKYLVRVMPNTPARIQSAVVGYCLSEGAEWIEGIIQEMFRPLGFVLKVEEGEPFEALTVSCASGPGFVFEFMQYWQDWIEGYGFDSDTARRMTVETFLGASLLAKQYESTPIEELQSQITSKKGVTQAGLDSIRELDIERALRISFEKAVLRERELGRTADKNVKEEFQS